MAALSEPAAAQAVEVYLDHLAVERGLAANTLLSYRRDLGRYLEQQWMQRQRSRPGATSWRPRRGLAADLRRGLDLNRSIALKGVGAVEVQTEPEDGGTRVDVAVSVSDARSEALGFLVALPVGLVAGVGAVVGALTTAPEALLSVPLTGVVGGAGWLGARAVVSSRRRQVAEAFEGVLDGLPAR